MGPLVDHFWERRFWTTPRSDMYLYYAYIVTKKLENRQIVRASICAAEIESRPIRPLKGCRNGFMNKYM